MTTHCFDGTVTDFFTSDTNTTAYVIQASGVQQP